MGDKYFNAVLSYVLPQSHSHLCCLNCSLYTIFPCLQLLILDCLTKRQQGKSKVFSYSSCWRGKLLTHTASNYFSANNCNGRHRYRDHTWQKEEVRLFLAFSCTHSTICLTTSFSFRFHHSASHRIQYPFSL